MAMKERLENIISKLKGKRALKQFKIIKKISQTILSAKVYSNTIQFFGGLSLFLGIILSALGFYGLATEKGILFEVGRGTISFDPTLAGVLSVLIGILLTVEGIMVLRVNFKISRLAIISLILGFCSLNVPAIFLGIGYSLVAGVFAIIFGYLWLITVLVWLQRGE